ncbi:trypsin-like peptidase domain-containing protein [Labrys neptuniae]
MQQLTGAQISDLARALATAVDLSELEDWVHVATGDQLDVYWADIKQPLLKVLRDLIKGLEQEGQTEPFLKVVYVNRPHRPDIRERIAALAPDAVSQTLTNAYDFVIQNQAQRGTEPKPDLLGPGLQRNIKPHLQMLDLSLWAANLSQTGRRVCRVDIGNNPAGTGFLVGPQAVLTNWHVVEAVAASGSLAGVSCRFDYARKPDGSFDQGEAVGLADDALLHHRPYAPAERTPSPDTPAPMATELDFALLHLAKPAGTERGWLTLPEHDSPLAEGAPLIIVQHPHGGPIKLAIDTEAILPNPAPSGRPRLRYATNTDPGSSGAPCLDMDWRLIALHHFGDPAWSEPKFNQGVPAGLIRADIVANGHGASLSAEPVS